MNCCFIIDFYFKKKTKLCIFKNFEKLEKNDLYKLLKKIRLNQNLENSFNYFYDEKGEKIFEEKKKLDKKLDFDFLMEKKKIKEIKIICDKRKMVFILSNMDRKNIFENKNITKKIKKVKNQFCFIKNLFLENFEKILKKDKKENLLNSKKNNNFQKVLNLENSKKSKKKKNLKNEKIENLAQEKINEFFESKFLNSVQYKLIYKNIKKITNDKLSLQNFQKILQTEKNIN